VDRMKPGIERRLIAFFALLSVPTLTWGQHPDFTPTTKALIEAMRAGGLPAAAVHVGHYVGIDGDGDSFVVALSLTDLAQECDAVIRVSVESQLPSQLTEDGSGITTDHVVTVTERFQGLGEVGSQVTLRMSGGRVAFKNQTTAELRGRVPRMRVGEDYVLFLKRPDTSRPFRPMLGSQGVFTFDSDGRTQPRARLSDSLFERYQGMPREQFLRVVRSSVFR
jgi:hypothetical protein